MAPVSASYAPVLLARDFQQTLGFYETVLDVTAEGSAPYAKITALKGILCVADGKWWAQVSGTEYAPSLAGPANQVLLIQVDDVQAQFERLVERGLNFLAPPTERPRMAVWNALLRDPDGRTVMLSSPTV